MKTPFPLRLLVILAALAIVAGTPRLQAAGTVYFGNCSSNQVVHDQTLLPVAASNAVQAALYWSPTGTNNFIQLGDPVRVGVPLAGIYVGGTRTTGPETAGGTAGTFQVRAWSGEAETYEEAVLVEGILVGQSEVFTNATGNPSGIPPRAPEPLLSGGLPKITMRVNEFPEPLLLITNLVVAAGGNAEISGLGQSNLTYGLEAARHLLVPIPWERIGSNTANALGIFQFTDTNAASIRFYRVVHP